MTFIELLDQFEPHDGALRIVAIDGPGGAGKSTFAGRLLARAEQAQIQAAVLHTDSFATPDHPLDWWPRLLDVIASVRAGRSATYRPFDWQTETLGAPSTIAPAGLIVIEGVSAGRSEWAEHLDMVIWVETPESIRRERGLTRDNVLAREWDAEARTEQRFYERDPVRDRADLIVSGTSQSSWYQDRFPLFE